MDIFAINNWDAWIYAYGANLINLLYSSVVWKAMVIIFTVFAFLKIAFSLKDSSNIIKDLFLKVGAVAVFSVLTLWPVTTTLNIYKITKAEAYTNVFKWIIPVGSGDELKANLYLSADVEFPPVLVAAGYVLGYLQFWTMWLVDKAGTTLGINSVSSAAFMNVGKLGVLEEEIRGGLDSVILSLKDKGMWTPDVQKEYAEVNQDLQDFFAKNCVDPGVVEGAWSSTVNGDPVSIDFFKDHINPNLTLSDQNECKEIISRMETNISDLCQKWSSANDGASEGICKTMVNVSTWDKIKNFFVSIKNSVKEKASLSYIIGTILGWLKDLVIGAAVSLAGILNMLLLGGIAMAAPIALGVINFFIFFLSPLFFLTQLVLGKFAESTIRVIFEMLWARLLYAVFVLAYALSTALQWPAWKAFLGLGAGTTSQLSGKIIAEVIAKKLGSALIASAGGLIGELTLLTLSMTHIALTLVVALTILFVGAKLLRTLIFNEALYIADILTGGRHRITKGLSSLIK